MQDIGLFWQLTIKTIDDLRIVGNENLTLEMYIMQLVHLKNIDAIAYTKGPGLRGPLLVGAAFSKPLAFALEIPTLPIHHMEAHLIMAKFDAPELKYPFMSLLVSGGHSLLAKVESPGKYEIIGESIDDAVGEAFDKTAKIKCGGSWC